METDRTSLIRRRAYELWDEQGRPHGHDVTHWLQAEAELTEIEQPPVPKAPRSGRMSTEKAVRPAARAHPAAATRSTGKR